MASIITKGLRAVQAWKHVRYRKESQKRCKIKTISQLTINFPSLDVILQFQYDCNTHPVIITYLVVVVVKIYKKINV